MTKKMTPEMQRVWDEMGDETAKLKVSFASLDWMFARYGVQGAIERLVTSGQIQPGFRKLIEHNRPDLTFEAFAARFPTWFNPGIAESAQFRIDNALDRRLA